MQEEIIGNIDDLHAYAQRFLETIVMGGKATVIGLSGNLGAGKTAFVKEVAKILGIHEDITSPTFVIQKNYPIDFHEFRTLIHIDAYRLEQGDDMKPLKFSETLEDAHNLIFIEWPERIESVLPTQMRKITFETINETTRKLTFYDKNE